VDLTIASVPLAVIIFCEEVNIKLITRVTNLVGAHKFVVVPRMVPTRTEEHNLDWAI